MTIDHQNNNSNADDLIEYRLTKLEQQYAEMKMDLKSMMDVLNRLDKKFSIVPEGGFQCGVHTIKMDSFRKDLDLFREDADKQKIILDDLSKFKWKSLGVLSVIILLIQLAGTAVFDKVIKTDVNHGSSPVKVELIIPGISTNSVSR